MQKSDNSVKWAAIFLEAVTKDGSLDKAKKNMIFKLFVGRHSSVVLFSSVWADIALWFGLAQCGQT